MTGPLFSFNPLISKIISPAGEPIRGCFFVLDFGKKTTSRQGYVGKELNVSQAWLGRAPGRPIERNLRFYGETSGKYRGHDPGCWFAFFSSRKMAAGSIQDTPFPLSKLFLPFFIALGCFRKFQKDNSGSFPRYSLHPPLRHQISDAFRARSAPGLMAAFVWKKSLVISPGPRTRRNSL